MMELVDDEKEGDLVKGSTRPIYEGDAMEIQQEGNLLVTAAQTRDPPLLRIELSRTKKYQCSSLDNCSLLF